MWPTQRHTQRGCQGHSSPRNSDDLLEEEVHPEDVNMSLQTTDCPETDRDTSSSISISASSEGSVATTGATIDSSFLDSALMSVEEQLAHSLQISTEDYISELNDQPKNVYPPEVTGFPLAPDEAVNKDKTLEDAVCHGNVAAVQQYVESGADLNITWKNNCYGFCLSPLTAAAFYGHPRVLRLLMEAGLSLEGPGVPHPSALHCAALKGDLEIVIFLLDKRVSVNAITHEGNTALHYAASEDHINCVNELCRYGADINAKNVHGHTPLSCAARNGNFDIMQLLYNADKSANTNKGATAMKALSEADAENSDGDAYSEEEETFLHHAAYSGHPEAVEFAALPVHRSDADTPWYMNTLEAVHTNPDDNKISTLKKAVQQGDVDTAQQYLCTGSDHTITWQDSDNGCLSLLTAAALSGHIEMVKLLMKEGLSLEGPGKPHPTALHCAALKGHSNIVRFLLKRGVNLEAKNQDGNTALHLAVIKGHTDCVHQLLHSGADINAFGECKSTPLLFAAGTGHAGAMNALIRAGANIRLEDKDRATPLHYAVSGGHADIVKELLSCGADIDAKDYAGDAPIHYVGSFGKYDALEELLKAGANINVRNKKGYTPLYYASENGHSHAMEELLKANADVNATSNNRDTPLHCAAIIQCVADEIGTLIRAGANVNAKGSNGEIPLHRAAAKNQVEILKELLEAGSNINTKDNNGSTALHSAASYGHLESIEELLKADANINAKDSNGDTPIHYASAKGELNAVKLLVREGADIKIHNNSNQTLLHLAAHSWNNRLVMYLVRTLGFDPEKEDGEGRIASAISEIKGDADTAWSLRKCQENVSETEDYTDLHSTWIGIEDEVKKIQDCVKNREKGPMDDNYGHLQDDTGMTVLHWAAKLGYNDKVFHLIEFCSIHPFLVNYKGQTPADVAQEEGHNNVLWVYQTLSSPKIKGTKEDLYEKLLYLITSSDDLKQARNLLWSGAPLTCVGSIATDALILAMERNRPQILSLLLAAGAPITTITTTGLSLLNLAFRNSDITLRTKTLILRTYIHTLLHEYQHVRDNKDLSTGIASFFNLSGSPINLEQIHKKLKTDKGYSKIIGRAKWPSSNYKDLSKLLTEAVDRNCPLVCSLLYQAGARTFLGRGDENPVIVAIKNQNWKILKAVIYSMGGSPYIYNSKGELALLKMPPDIRQEIEQITYEKERRRLERFRDAKKNDLEKEEMEEILKLQQDLFDCHRNNDHEEILNLLPPEKILLGTAGIVMAVQRGLPQLIFLLVKVGGYDVNTIVDKTMGTTPLHHAVSNGKGKCVSLLLDLGANLYQGDYYGHSALHFAAMFGYVDVYHFLLQHDEYEECYSRAKTTPADVCFGFEMYLESYKKCGERSIKAQEIFHCDDPTEATEKLLSCLKWEMLVKEADKVNIDFTKGESKAVRDAVLKELRIICNKVQELDDTYKGTLSLGGSSSDGTKLYAPDEVDVNVLLDKSLLKRVEVVDNDDEVLFRNGHEKVFVVELNNPNLEGNDLVINFQKLVMKSLETHRLTDERLSLVPPGVTKTQVGVDIHMAWQGEEYPLLLIGTDLLPVVEVPWSQEEVSRPYLTPPDRQTFHLSNTTDGFWRGSFAGVEAAILRGLNPEEHIVYIICKILLSCMKAEPWMSRKKKNLYSWWSSRDWRISVPTTFALKNAFFKCLERKRQRGMEWPKEDLLQWVSLVFGEMCRDFDPASNNVECKEPNKIHPYFAGNFQQHKNGSGAPEIVRYLSKLMKKYDERQRNKASKDEKNRKRERGREMLQYSKRRK